MSFLNKLFGGGDSRPKLILNDAELGQFSALSSTKNRIIWKGQAYFCGDNVELFIHGEEGKLDTTQKSSAGAILNNQQMIEQELNRVLQEEYENAGKAYNNWQTHFICICISATERSINITMEEKESFYHFNIDFVNNKSTGVSIDS